MRSHHAASLWPTQEHARVEAARSPAKSGATVFKVGVVNGMVGWQPTCLSKCIQLECLEDPFRVVFGGHAIPFFGKKWQASFETNISLEGGFTLVRNHESLIRVNCECEPRCCQESGGCCFITKPGLKKSWKIHGSCRYLRSRRLLRDDWSVGLGVWFFSHVGTPTSLDTGYNFWTGGSVSPQTADLVIGILPEVGIVKFTLMIRTSDPYHPCMVYLYTYTYMW